MENRKFDDDTGLVAIRRCTGSEMQINRDEVSQISNVKRWPVIEVSVLQAPSGCVP